MKKVKLTPLAKGLIFFIVTLLLGSGLYFSGVFTKAKGQLNAFKGLSEDEMYSKVESINKEEGVINISLDEWIGWKSIIDANGGLTTQKGSIYDKLGIKLNISVINDATQSSNALIKGDLDGAGYTVNRYAFLYNKFQENNTDVKMGFITNSSTGGDGIIAKPEIKKVEDLIGKVIGVPRYSEAQTLVEWLLQKSTLTDEQIADIRSKMVYFDTPDDAAKAFFAGELDAAATWEPYLTQATGLTSAHTLFSTANATNIVLDGIVFRQDFIDKNPETISKLLEGALLAAEDYKTETKAIKNTFPMFATASNEEIIEMTDTATLYNCASNIEALGRNGAAQALFADMSDIWASLGESANRKNASKAFDVSFAEALEDKFQNDEVQNVEFTKEQLEEAKNQSNDEALLTQNLTINFEPDSTQISADSFDELVEFANTAKILNGVVIQIEGNTAKVPGEDGIDFSRRRAESVSKFLMTQGVDPSRFVIIGNGDTKPISDNPEENRRTDIYFKAVGM